MTTVTIGGTQMPDGQISPSWIREQIENRRRTGQQVCVVVRIQSGGVNVTLTTPACGEGRGGRMPCADELKLIELWKKRGMNQDSFDTSQLIAFLNETKHA